jgi:hypothetical protein
MLLNGTSKIKKQEMSYINLFWNEYGLQQSYIIIMLKIQNDTNSRMMTT